MPSLQKGNSGLVYSTVLAADSATIDTGANAIPATGAILDIFLVCRTDETATSSAAVVTFNGDGTAIYDRNTTTNVNTTASGTANVAAAGVAISIAAASNAANVASSARLVVPAYASTTFYKSGTAQFGVPDTTAANQRNTVGVFEWRNTAAINQISLAITSGSGQKFKAGSALYIYVR